MPQNPQVSTTVSPELYSDILLIAEKESRSVSSIVSILLQQAVKERKRKRKNAKEDNS
jgi:hypothetical protein